MNLIVWGTGKLYHKYRKLLMQFEITKFCDNNSELQGKFMDGIEIIAPGDLEKYSFTYVVIMTYAAKQVYCQIRRMGIADERVLLYSQLWQLSDESAVIHMGKKTVYYKEWIAEREDSILLVSHNFSYTGVPVALKNMATVLRRMGYSILMAAMETGTFVQELEDEEIAYMDNLEIGYRSKELLEVLGRFKTVVIGTLTLYELAAALESSNNQVIWWIHETYEKYYAGKETLPLKNRAKFLAGGERVQKAFQRHYEDVRIEKLQYCLPDSCRNKAINRENRQLVIAVIGTVDERKAQDILLKALIRLSVKYKELCRLVIIGKMDESTEFSYRIRALAERMGKLEWIQEMGQKELDIFFGNMDVLVCPSRDDPMPIVVTQAMMHEKVCVVSENVGQAAFIRQYENGFVFPNEDVLALAEIIKWLLENGEKRAAIGRAARKIYEEEFSEKVMEGKMQMILRQLQGDGLENQSLDPVTVNNAY